MLSAAAAVPSAKPQVILSKQDEFNQVLAEYQKLYKSDYKKLLTAIKPHQFWRFFIDGDFQNKGWIDFEKREAGYLLGMMTAFKELLITLLLRNYLLIKNGFPPMICDNNPNIISGSSLKDLLPIYIENMKRTFALAKGVEPYQACTSDIIKQLKPEQKEYAAKVETVAQSCVDLFKLDPKPKLSKDKNNLIRLKIKNGLTKTFSSRSYLHLKSAGFFKGRLNKFLPLRVKNTASSARKQYDDSSLHIKPK